MLAKGFLTVQGVVALLAFSALAPFLLLHQQPVPHHVDDLAATAAPKIELPIQTKLPTKAKSSKPLRIENNPDFLWNADASPKTRTINLQTVGTINMTVVIAHCDKSLEWIPDYIVPKSKHVRVNEIQIYSKCGNPVIGLDVINGAFPKAKLTTEILPNVGRCDHTYARWMRMNADAIDVGPNDVAMFLKDNDHRKGLRDTLEIVEFDHLMGNAITYGFACVESEKTVHMPRADRQLRYASPFYGVTILRKFSMDDYAREKRDEADTANFNSIYASVGEWIDALQLKAYESEFIPGRPEKTPLTQACFGGMFAVTREQLRTAQNTSSYQAIETSLSRGSNIEEGHFCERTWASLFFKPFEGKRLYAVVDQARKVGSVQVNRWRVGRIMGVPVTNHTEPDTPV